MRRNELNELRDSHSTNTQEPNESIDIQNTRIKLQMQIAGHRAEDRIEAEYEQQLQQLHTTNAQKMRRQNIARKEAELQLLQNVEITRSASPHLIQPGNAPSRDLRIELNRVDLPQLLPVNPNENPIQSENLQYDNHHNAAIRSTSDTEWSPESQDDIHMLPPPHVQQSQEPQPSRFNLAFMSTRENQPGRISPTTQLPVDLNTDLQLLTCLPMTNTKSTITTTTPAITTGIPTIIPINTSSSINAQEQPGGTHSHMVQ